MSRIRSIKPEFFSDEKIARLSRDARLFFVGMWPVCCDDYGVSRAHPGYLKQVFPYDEDVTPKQIGRWLEELETHGFISRFESGGESYLYVWGWKHQKVDHPSKCRNPAPPETLARGSRVSRAVLAPDQDLGSGPGPGPNLAPQVAAGTLLPFPALSAGDTAPAKKTAKSTRHGPLVAALTETFAAVRGVKYGFDGGKDARAVQRLIRMEQNDAEIIARWKRGLSARYQPCNSIADLAMRWNAYTGTISNGDASRGVAAPSEWTPQEIADFVSMGNGGK